MRGLRHRLRCVLLLGIAASGCASHLTPVTDDAAAKAPREVANSQPQRPRAPEPRRVWDLTGHLSVEQRLINNVIYGSLADDPCARENDFDPMVRQWVDDGSPAALDALAVFTQRTEYGREGQAAAARGYVHLAQQALARDDLAKAAGHGLHVFLSGAPHRVRLEALRVHCWSGDPQRIQRNIELIESGRQDARFRALLPEMRRALARRAKQTAK
ncbi:MAG: hypothetical protein AAF581_06595 [Planctomycetota bacterium]